MPAQQSSSITAPVYTVTLRDWQTLEIIDRIVWFESLAWTRRLYDAGDFTLRTNDDLLDCACVLVATPGGEWAVEEHVVEIRRDGELEFAGMLDGVELVDATGELTLRGVDLRAAWLAGRLIVPPSGSEFDSQSSAAASDAIRHYVEDQLSAPVEVDRDADAELDGISWEAGSGSAIGETVSYHARYVNLLTAIQALAREGDLIVDVGFQADYAGYALEISVPADRAEGTADAMVFSEKLGTGEVIFRSERRRHANVVYALGQGSGAQRTVIERGDDDDLAIHRRIESALDARNSPTTATLTLTGDPADTETVSIGGKTYTFQATLTNSDGNVLIGANRQESLANLRAALNLLDGAGTLYAAATTANAAARASDLQGGALVVAATGASTPVALAETLAAGTWSAAEIDLTALQTAGDAHLQRLRLASRQVTVLPDPGAAPYRTAWDLGDDVTVRIERLDAAFNQRISEVRVSLNEQQFETVRVTVGEPPASLPKLLAGALGETNNVLRG